MPYDPTPVASGDILHVHVGGAPGTQDQTFALGRPRDGLVDVRETVGALPPREYVEQAVVLMERFVHAHHERRTLSVDLHGIQRWLTP